MRILIIAIVGVALYLWYKSTSAVNAVSTQVPRAVAFFTTSLSGTANAVAGTPVIPVTPISNISANLLKGLSAGGSASDAGAPNSNPDSAVIPLPNIADSLKSYLV